MVLSVAVPVYGPLLPLAVAKERGLKRYFTGRLCVNGHIALRIVSTETCEECRRTYRRQYKNNEEKRPLIMASHQRRAKRLYRNCLAHRKSKQIMAATTAQVRRIASGTQSRRVGCYTQATAEQLRSYLAAQFRPEFTWANYGDKWVVDHIRPFASFDLRDPSQARLCGMWFNLQPLTQRENREKSDRWTCEDEAAWASWVRGHCYEGDLYLQHCANVVRFAQ